MVVAPVSAVTFTERESLDETDTRCRRVWLDWPLA